MASHISPKIEDTVQTVSSILRKHGASQIILYGSYARGDYRPDSDIDLCVAGISDEDYFRTVAECLMNVDRPVSIIDLKNVDGYFRERILSEGKIIYENR